jgi:DNA adenine methylase
MKSPLNYLGGKSRLASRIVDMIPADHECYCEAFSGAAWVLFTKHPSQHEVINDADGELANFWRVVQNHIAPLLDLFKNAIVSRQVFEWEKAKRPETLTDLQRAVRYYYTQRQSYAGKTRSRVFSSGPSRPSNFNLNSLEESLMESHWRLKRVTIEYLDALACIRRYDRPATVFYLDPPYYFSTKDYAVEFPRERFEEMADMLGKIKGRFILSLNDCPEVRKLFGNFDQQAVRLKYSCTNGSTEGGAEAMATDRSELLISNVRTRKGIGKRSLPR